MPRRSRRGYYVAGDFVAAGSEADREFRAEIKGTEDQSRTERKHASEQLQDLGVALETLRPDLFDALPLPDKLRESIVEVRRLTHFGALRRQRQFIGKLMRGLDDNELAAVTAALDTQHAQSAEEARRLHEIEQWRDRLIAGDAALTAWLDAHPDTDAGRLRALVRQARRDAEAHARDGPARRHGRAYRQIFALLRAQLEAEEG
jgi:ribosome-associated protein